MAQIHAGARLPLQGQWRLQQVASGGLSRQLDAESQGLFAFKKLAGGSEAAVLRVCGNSCDETGDRIGQLKFGVAFTGWQHPNRFPKEGLRKIRPGRGVFTKKPDMAVLSHHLQGW